MGTTPRLRVSASAPKSESSSGSRLFLVTLQQVPVPKLGYPLPLAQERGPRGMCGTQRPGTCVPAGLWRRQLCLWFPQGCGLLPYPFYD